MSGFGMVKVAGPAVPPDFDVASLLKPESVKLGALGLASVVSVPR